MHSNEFTVIQIMYFNVIHNAMRKILITNTPYLKATPSPRPSFRLACSFIMAKFRGDPYILRNVGPKVGRNPKKKHIKKLKQQIIFLYHFFQSLRMASTKAEKSMT